MAGMRSVKAVIRKNWNVVGWFVVGKPNGNCHSLVLSKLFTVEKLAGKYINSATVASLVRLFKIFVNLVVNHSRLRVAMETKHGQFQVDLMGNSIPFKVRQITIPTNFIMQFLLAPSNQCYVIACLLTKLFTASCCFFSCLHHF